LLDSKIRFLKSRKRLAEMRIGQRLDNTIGIIWPNSTCAIKINTGEHNKNPSSQLCKNIHCSFITNLLLRGHPLMNLLRNLPILHSQHSTGVQSTHPKNTGPILPRCAFCCPTEPAAPTFRCHYYWYCRSGRRPDNRLPAGSLAVQRSSPSSRPSCS
jgi:hypothetical protein